MEGDIRSTWYSTWDTVDAHKVADDVTSIVTVELIINIIPCEIIFLLELAPSSKWTGMSACASG